MEYDYLTINFSSIAGFVFLLIFLYANSSLDIRIKKTFYLLIFVEFIEMAAYSLELWTTTFDTLSPLRLWLSAIGYAVRPVIFCLILMLTLRNTERQRFSKLLYIPAAVNVVGAFSVFFTDIVYFYTPDNQFHRGPLGYLTYVVVILYLILLMVIVVRSQTNRSKLEVLIIFAACMLLFFAMAAEAIFAIRTLGRASIIMVTVFYYMFFQTQVHNASLSREQIMRMKLEHDNKIDGSTGVLNKSAFCEAAKSILAGNNGQMLSSVGFIFMDLDYLKKLNDTLGHVFGDMAIADTAEILQSVWRKTDLIGRFGGDEFYIMLPDIPRARFYDCLDEAQAGLQREYSNGELKVAISASTGAVFAEHVEGLSYEQLVALADDALYEAKAQGRNCHVVREL